MRAARIIKKLELLHRNGDFHASVTLECADVDVARRRAEHHAIAADWGVSNLPTLVRTDGPHEEVVDVVENPRWSHASATTVQ